MTGFIEKCPAGAKCFTFIGTRNRKGASSSWKLLGISILMFQKGNIYEVIVFLYSVVLVNDILPDKRLQNNILNNFKVEAMKTSVYIETHFGISINHVARRCNEQKSRCNSIKVHADKTYDNI